MPGPRDKAPPSPDFDFGDEDEVPTGNGPPLLPRQAAEVLAQRANKRSRPTPVTLPAPPASPTPTRSAAQRSPVPRTAEPDPHPPADDTIRGVSPFAPREPAHRGEYVDPFADDPMFANFDDPAADAAQTAAHAPARSLESERPTREAPPNPGQKSMGPVAPPPPRLPRMVGPEPDFAFGWEPSPIPAAADREEAPTMQAPLPLVDLDPPWDRRGGEDFAEAPAPRDPTTRPPPAPAHARAEPEPFAAPASGSGPVREMRDRFALGDYSGALIVAESLASDGHDEAARVVAECRKRLEQMYASRLGSLTHVPVVAVPRSELKWLSLDHRAGFVLSLVDGVSCVEDILDVAGMPALEVLRTLYELHTQRVIELKATRR